MCQALLSTTVTTVASERAAGPLVRPATREDLLGVVEIERQSFPQPWPTSAFERFLDATAFFVAVEQTSPAARSVIGYVVADAIPNNGQPLGHVVDLAVHPDRRNGGVGRLLLQRTIPGYYNDGENALVIVRSP